MFVVLWVCHFVQVCLEHKVILLSCAFFSPLSSTVDLFQEFSVTRVQMFVNVKERRSKTHDRTERQKDWWLKKKKKASFLYCQCWCQWSILAKRLTNIGAVATILNERWGGGRDGLVQNPVDIETVRIFLSPEFLWLWKCGTVTDSSPKMWCWAPRACRSYRSSQPRKWKSWWVFFLNWVFPQSGFVGGIKQCHF